MRKSKAIVVGRAGGVGIRRILRIGGSSLVSIPREYLASKGLKVGDELRVSWDGELKFSPLVEGSEVGREAEE